MQAWEVANKLGLVGPAMEQPQYNMFEREKVTMTAPTRQFVPRVVQQDQAFYLVHF